MTPSLFPPDDILLKRIVAPPNEFQTHQEGFRLHLRLQTLEPIAKLEEYGFDVYATEYRNDHLYVLMLHRMIQ